VYKPQRKHVTYLIAVLTVLLLIARWIQGPSFPTSVRFVFAAILFFHFGSSLQLHALNTIGKFRMSWRTFLWLTAAVAFWYSTVIWVWWSRQTPNFPLFLLNDDLHITLFYEWVAFAVVADRLGERA
jgi:hypothetical protein